LLSPASIAAAAAIAESFKAIDDSHEAKGLHRRGALLAQIDLYSSLVYCADPASSANLILIVEETSLQLIQQFITRFSTLSSCALDLSPYFLRLSSQLLRKFLQQLPSFPPHAVALTEDLDSYDSPHQLARRCSSVCSVNRIMVMAESRIQITAHFELPVPRIQQVSPLQFNS
jgi:hypothetical protein